MTKHAPRIPRCLAPMLLAAALLADAGLTQAASNLLRNDEITGLRPLAPPRAAIFTGTGSGCSTDETVTLDAGAPGDCSRTPGEGSELTANGSQDDDDFYVASFYTSGGAVADPELPRGLLSDASRPLVFYQVEAACTANGLRLVKDVGGEMVRLDHGRCGPGPGACCEPDGDCGRFLTETDCVAAGSTWVVGAACTDIPSPCAPAPCDTNGSGGPVGTSLDLSMDVLGTTRQYNRHVPDDYDPARAYPVLVFYHGLGSNHHAAASAYYGLIDLADANDFIALFPNSLTIPECGGIPAGKHWDVCESEPDPTTSQDVLFTRQLIAETSALYNVCVDNIYTHGHSYGAYFSYYTATTLPDEIAAFAEHSGGLKVFFPGICFPRCLPTGIRRLPGVLIHSTDDTVVPWADSELLDSELTTAGHEAWFITLAGWDHDFNRGTNQDVWDWLMARPLP